MEEKINITNYLTKTAFLYMCGVNFIEDKNDKRKVKFTIPEFIDFTKEDIGYDGPYNFDTRENLIEMVKGISKETTFELMKDVLEVQMANEGDTDLFNDEDVTDFIKSMVPEIKFLCKVREGEHWNIEAGKKAAEDFIEKTQKELKENDGFSEV